MRSTCPICGKRAVHYSEDALRARENAWVRYNTAEHSQKRQQELDDWLALCNKQPMQILTEEDWLEACNYFNKCALCTEQEIDVRKFFIRFEDGGKYTPWNIIPACELCATDLRIQHNPFRYLHHKFKTNNDRGQTAYGNIKIITKYLKSRMIIK